MGLLVTGSAILLAHLGLLGFQLRLFFNASPVDLLSSCVGLGVASIHVLQFVAFNQGALFSFVDKILLLFSALAVIVTGLALSQNQAAKTVDRLHAQEPRKGDQ